MKAIVERHRLNSTLRRLSTGVGTVAPLIVQASPGAVELLAVGKDAVMHAGVDASVEAEGCAELMLRQMVSVVKSFPNGRVALDSGEEGVALSSGGARVVLAESDDLCGAELPDPPDAGTEVDGAALRAALGGVIPSAATDNHPIFGSLRFDESDGAMRLVASDTFRLAVRDLPGTAPQGVFSVSARAVKRMLRSLGKPPAYRLWMDDGYAWFCVEGLGKMGIVCDRSDYPRYRGWSPPWEAKMVCARRPLADLADRVVSLDRKSPAPARLVFSESGIEFTAKSPLGMVSGSVKAEQAELPKEVTLRFNSLYLADALGNLLSDQVEIRLAEDPLARPKPVLIADAQHPEAWNLVMPMRTG